MSRVGKNPITLPAGVEVKVAKTSLTVKGPKGELRRTIHPDLNITIQDGELTVKRPNDSKFFRSIHGLYRTLIHNMVEGVTKAFEKKLEIVGVGYKAEARNNRLILQLGYSHSIIFVPPEGVVLKTDTPTSISISGIDNEIVGQVAAKIRSFRPPEPYKGKGIKYSDEHVRRKAGKTAA